MSLELLTPKVIDGWKRVATAQLDNYRERIVIPTTLLLAMINKIQANELKMNMIERTVVYGIPAYYYTVEETRLLMDDIIGVKTLDTDKWAEIVTNARKRLSNNEPVADVGEKK